MDELDRAREIGAGVMLTPAQLATAQAKVNRGISEKGARRTRTRWWIGVGGVLSAAAATVAIVIALTSAPAPAPVGDAAPPNPPLPDSSVSPAPPEPTDLPTTPQSTLERAAELASVSSGYALANGNYLRVEHTTEQLVTYAIDAPHSPYNATRASATAAWLSIGSYFTYIPADRSAEWVRVFEPGREIVAFWGTDAEALSEQWRDAIGGGIGDVLRSTGGLWEGVAPLPGSDAYYEPMPRDPAALLEWYREQYAGQSSDVPVDDSVAAVLAQELELNAAPADLRAAMFRALALVPGVSLQSVNGNLATLAFEYNSAVRSLRTLTVDTGTGLVSSSTLTQDPGPGIVPESVPGFRVTTTITVVDSAP